MNEELRIIIRAITQDAQRNLEQVRRELDNISDSGSESGKSIDDAMKAVGKGVAVAAAAFTALAAAVVALGKSSMEFQKEQAKLIAGFQSAGSTAKQASETYQNLFRFLGETDTAVEAAQSLARITTNQKELAEWTQILQGVYARAGDAIPVESLAEAANETIKVGQATGAVSDALNWLGVSEDEFNAKLATTASLEEREVLLRSTLNSLYANAANIYEHNNQSILRYNESQAKLDTALAQATAYVVPLLTQLNNLAAALLVYLKPAFETISAVLIVFCQWVIAAIQYVGAFFGIFDEGAASTDEVASSIEQIQSNTSSVVSGTQDYTGALEEATKQAMELKKQTMGFDELNIVGSQTAPSIGGGSSGGAGGGGGGVAIPDIGALDLSLSSMEGFKADLEETKKKIEGILTLAGLVAAGFATWKIVNFLQELITARKLIAIAGQEGALTYQKVAGKKAQEALDGMKSKLINIAGTALIVAGAFATVYGYSDAWANGIDWGNLAMMIGGIGAVVGGLAMTFGPLAAQIGLIIGGLALLVIGIKDLITNGYSMEAVITVVIGVLAVVIGLIWAFNAALLANPITWIILAIVALVAAFVILWNECDGFRQFWINLWEGIKNVFHAVVEWIKKAFTAVVDFFKNNWQALLLLLVNPFAGAFKLLYDNCDGFREFIDNLLQKIGGFFANLWDNIKRIFSGIGQWFSNIFSGAANGIKRAFSSIGDFFSGIWTKIKNIFSNVGATIGNAITNTVKKAVNGVLSVAVKIINGFISAINLAISVINAIPGVNISKLNKLDVPQLAKGGVINSATLAVVGEAGKEAVLPLENNTGWMDALADRIAARNSTPSKIVLKVGEKELGYATIGAINNITEQTGTLPLVVI